MGYTHYWRRKTEIPAEKFAQIVADCKRLADSIPIPLGDGAGEGEPIFEAEMIVFNGHRDSGSFSRDGEGLCWPEPKADGCPTVGQTAITGNNWCAGRMLSGRAADANGDGTYETFHIDRVREKYERDEERQEFFFDCCKTNFRPYDLLVQCALIVCKEHLGDDFIVTSDGTQENWNEAADGCQVFLGYGLTFTLDSHETAKAADDYRTPIPVPTAEEIAARDAERARRAASIKSKQPDWAGGIIVAELCENTSDPYQDYHSHSVKRRVAIGWRKGTRDNFKAMRKAAAQFPETVHLGPGRDDYRVYVVFTNDIRSNGSAYWKGSLSHWHGDVQHFGTKAEADAYVAAQGKPHDINFEGKTGTFEWEIRCESFEHRERWSMGAGNYLKDGHDDADGWMIRCYHLPTRFEDLEDGLPGGSTPIAVVAPVAKAAPAPEPTPAPKTVVAVEDFAWIAFI